MVFLDSRAVSLVGMQTTQQLVVCGGAVYLMGMCPLAEK